MNEILIESIDCYFLVNLILRLHADYISGACRKTGEERKNFLDFVYIFLLRNKDSFIEFTFALEPNKVNV